MTWTHRAAAWAVAAAALAGCKNDDVAGPEGNKLVPLGQWAGGDAGNPIRFIILTTRADGATFRDNAQCSYGEIAEPLRMDEDGQFRAEARVLRMAGTPSRALLEGRVKGGVLSLRLTIEARTDEYELILNGPVPHPRFVC